MSLTPLPTRLRKKPSPQGWEHWIGVVFWIAVAFVFIDYIRTLLTLRRRK
jgi:hypothetical protein